MPSSPFGLRASTVRSLHTHTMFSTLRLRSQAPQELTPPESLNPYKAKRPWPPDFTTLSRKHQFRLERRYRRRAKLAWARPKWTKAIKLTQWGSGIFVVAYAVFYMDTGKDSEVFSPVREWYKGLADSLWTKTTHLPRPEAPRSQSNAPPTSS